MTWTDTRSEQEEVPKNDAARLDQEEMPADDAARPDRGTESCLASPSAEGETRKASSPGGPSAAPDASAGSPDRSEAGESQASGDLDAPELKEPDGSLKIPPSPTFAFRVPQAA